jgi:hypothetical protein
MKLTLEIYTEKSFVVRGDSSEYINNMKELGGKWNASLTDKKTGEKFGAWIFPLGKKEVVETFLNTKKMPRSGPSSPDVVAPIKTKNSDLERITEQFISINKKLEIFMDRMENRMNKTDARISKLMDLVEKIYYSEDEGEGDKKDDEGDDDESDEGDVVPTKRLLK